MKKIYSFGIIILFVSFMVSADAGIKLKEDDYKSNLSYKQKIQTQYSNKNSRDKNDDFIFLFYADSRGQPYSNWHQKRHEEFVSKMLENEKNNNVKHLIFGGDNVWLGFLNGQWNRFFKIMDKFTNKDIKIYPALGNHELILARFLYAVKKWIKDKDNILVKRIAEIIEKRETMGKRALEYFLLKNPKFVVSIMIQLREMMKDPSFNSEVRKFIDLLKKEDTYPNERNATTMLEIIDRIYTVAQIVSLSKFQYYSIEDDEIHPAHLKRFRKYVDKWTHLKETVYPDKTYYSVILPNEDDPKVKLIILDSNIKDNPEQGRWYENQLKEKFSGPIIVACHHPIFYNKKDESNWFERKVLPHMVLAGHHHDYERLSGDDEVYGPPVYIISGSGGAQLDYKTHISEEIIKKHAVLFNYLRIVIKSDYIQIKAYGLKKKEGELKFVEIEEMNLMQKK